MLCNVYLIPAAALLREEFSPTFVSLGTNTSRINDSINWSEIILLCCFFPSLYSLYFFFLSKADNEQAKV